MKTFCLFLAVALANSVVAYFIKTESENFQWQDIETNETNITNVQGSEGETETNKSHTRQLFGTKDDASSSKQLVPVGTKDQPAHTHTDESKQLQLIAKKTDQKHEQKMKGFGSIAKKYAEKFGPAVIKAFPNMPAAMKLKLPNLGFKEGYTKAKSNFDAWKTKYPVKAATLKFVGGCAFAIGDAIVTTMIVAACPPLVGILIADAVIELASAVFDLAGGTGTDEQTARVAWNGLALVLAIGGIDGEGTPGADASALAKAMGESYYGVTGNLAGEIADAMGGGLTPEALEARKKTLDDAAAQASAKAQNDELKKQLTAAGKVVTVGNKKRRIIFGGHIDQADIKAAIDASKAAR